MSETWRTLKEWPELILERIEDAGVARIVLNRPDKRNCWNRALCLAFLEALEIIRADKELKVVITKAPALSTPRALTSTSCVKSRTARCSTGTARASPSRSPKRYAHSPASPLRRCTAIASAARWAS
jgi:1,4-dihydroxy-2-naphthoyl-CoA synthase